MKIILQYLIPGLTAVIAIFFLGRKAGLKKKDEEVDAVQAIAEEEIAEAGNQAAKAVADATRAKTEAEILKDTVKIIGSRYDQDDNNTLKEKARQKDVDVSALVSEILASSKSKAQEAEKRYEK